MIIDSSIAVAVCLGEADAENLIMILEDQESIRMSAASVAEAGIVLDSRRPGAFDAFLHALDVNIIAVDSKQATLARKAYLRYGKGSGHPAQLNFGDALAYAAAVSSSEPLLFKGDDFVHTDVPRFFT
jgi:ribonuclease VapC